MEQKPVCKEKQTSPRPKKGSKRKPSKRDYSQPKPKPDHHSSNTGPGRASGIKPTAKEVIKRIRQAAELICSGHRRSQIIEAMCSEYGVAWQTVQEYCRRARELLIEESGKPKHEHVAEVLGEYQVLLRDADHGNKLHALKGKRELLGLDQPKKTEISGPAGGKIELEHKVGKPIDYARLEGLASTLFGVPSPDDNGESLHPADTGTQAGSLPKPYRH